MTSLLDSKRMRTRSSRRWGARLVPLSAAAVLGIVFVQPASAAAALKVVTTTPAYADIVKQIGGDHVDVQSIMIGPESIHNVRAKPSHMIKLKKAALFIHSGLDAELWAPLLVKGSRNKKLLPGSPGNIDVSKGIKLKEIPTVRSRALGDIHAYGNIHYYLDPLNGIKIARTIADALKVADPERAEVFESNFKAYEERLHQLNDRLVALMKPFEGTPVVVYHRTWPYFRDRFGLVRVTEVEPKPGIAPGPRHLTECVEAMRSGSVKIVILETYNNKKNAETVARRAGGQAVMLASMVKAVPGVDTYEKMFEYNVEQLLKAFKEAGIEPRPHDSDGG